MAGPCWLSVIVPTYNGAPYLAEALEGIVREADPSIEVVAVDDGSTDDTLAILGRYQTRLALRVLRQPHGGNWVASTNAGLRQARGRYACFLHQDDRWEPGRTRAVRDAIGPGPLTLVLHDAWFIDEAGRRLGRWRCPLPAGSLLAADPVVERLLVQNFVAIPSPAFSRAAALEAGGLDEALWYTADWDFWLKLGAAGTTRYLPDPLAAFRVHPASQTARRSRDGPAFRRQLECVLERHLPAWQARHPGRPDLTRAARFSVELNVALAAVLHGEPAPWGRLACLAARLGPRGWRRYLRDARLAERLLPRLRLARHGTGPPAPATADP